MTTNTNRYAILRSIVDGEWLPAPILDTKPEATAYMLGFDAACEALGTGASVLILDLSTGHVDGLDMLDDGDYDALKVFVAEAFGIDLSPRTGEAITRRGRALALWTRGPSRDSMAALNRRRGRSS